jgi:pimeloyl-ACP methyl ester carboxylesterase
MREQSRFIDVPGGRLKVVDEGEGPPILLVHSAIVDLRSWDDVVPRLVEAGYRAIRYDVRGYGESTTDDVDFSNRADLLAVLDAVGAERAALVGNSRGGQIALDALVESPERFVALVWVAGGVTGFDPGDPTAEEMPYWEEGDRLEQAGDADGMADLDVRIWVDGMGQPPTRVPARIREAVRMMDLPLVTPGRVFGKPIPLDPPTNGRLGTIRVPVVAVAGKLDTSGTRAAALRIGQAVPGAKVVLLDGVAHMIGMEVPDTLATIIVDALAPLPRWS